jgi:hypothetical protein
MLLAVVVLVPLAIAVAVTLWSLEQARYRPKAKGTVRTSSGVSRRRAAEAVEPSPPAPRLPQRERGDAAGSSRPSQ